MIPADFIAEWRAHTRWPTDEQVEQDLVLCRALVAIFEDAELAGAVALRGGTALHKLHFSPAQRYSEDIDLVQLRQGPIGSTIDRLRARLDSWLGEPKRERGEGVRLIDRFESEIPPRVRLRLKIEANTREHFTVRGTTNRRFEKGRDLFDLCVALDAGVDPTAVVDIFHVYTKSGGHHITRALFEENLASKIHLPAFTDDIPRLLPTGVTFDIAAGAERVQRELIALVPGDPWKGKPKRGARPPRSGKG